jgi:hypothetical protein
MELHRHPAVAAGAPRRCFKRKVTAGTGRGFLELLVICRELRLPLAHQFRQLGEVRRHAAASSLGEALSEGHPARLFSGGSFFDR